MNHERLIAPLAPPATTLVARLGYWAEHTPGALAFAFWSGDEHDVDDSLTFAELDRKARALAAEFAARGLSGERALLLYPPGLEFVTALFGCFYAGVVAVPAYPPRRNRNMERIEAIGANAEAAAVLTTDKIISRGAMLAETAPLLRNLPWLATDRLSESSAVWDSPPVSAEGVALLQYTSGSTGAPKGVILTHGNLIHNCALIACGFEPCHQTGGGFFWLPMYHDMGLVGGLLEPIFLGCPSVLMPPLNFLQKPIRWLRGISRFGTEMSGGPNFAYALCNEKITPQQCEGLDLSSWNVAFNGAEPVRAETLEAFTRKFAPYGFRAEMHYPCYGMAEATLIITGGNKRQRPTVRAFDARALDEHRAVALVNGKPEGRRLVSSGSALADEQVVIVDPDTRRRLPDEQVGEVWVRSPSVAQGYWNDYAETQRTFRAELADEPQANGRGEAQHFLRTGDLGFLHQGELFITGRSKDLIILRGRNVYPQDVEQTVESSHPALRLGGGACFSVEPENGEPEAGRPDAGSQEERLIVVHELERQQRGFDSQALIDAIRAAVLEQHEVPLAGVLLLRAGRLPKTSSGKVQRRACREAYLRGELQSVAEWMAQPTETWAEAESDSPPSAARRDGAAYADRGNHGEANGSPAGNPGRAAAEIRDWLAARIAARLQRPAAAIDVDAPFARFGLDSLALVEISGELADHLGRPISPTVLYGHPTIAELAEHLAAPDAATWDEDARQLPTAEPIAIVSAACRFPGADNVAEYWQLLCDGRDAVGEVPRDRWNIDAYYDANPAALSKMYTRQGAFVRDVDLFDPQFFSIAPREAAAIDPQQRLLLEVAWETLENAGLPPDTLVGDAVGVFVGISNCDYARLQGRKSNLDFIDAYTGTGTALSIAAGRLAHVLGVQGPCLAVDTACSSSLAAVHLAVQSLRGGECRAALAGGVNLILDPTATVALSRLQALSPDGRCKTFDASADGYGRGEGCGLVLLKRLSDALRDGDRVWALIRGSAINHDGRSNGLTAPHGPSQESVLRSALHNAGVRADEVGYIEAHGTGTSLGDPIEVEALAKVLCAGRSPAQPLLLGSVKTNIGHLESAAGVAGLIKTVLALRHGKIPATLHLTNPNPYIAWDKLPIEAPTQLAAWPEPLRRRIAGVSSFGFSGTNVHVLLEESPEPPAAEARVERASHVLVLSAKDATALRESAGRCADHLDGSDGQFADVCHTAACGRSHFAHRLAVAAESAQQARERLTQFREGRQTPGVACGRSDPQRPPKLAFLFSGQGAQYSGMARELYHSQPTFRAALDRCDEILREHLPRPLLESIFAGDGGPSPLDQTLYTQPALFAVEAALYELWSSWGVAPALLLGHSVGEYTAAWAAGVFSLEDALRLIAARGRLMQALPEAGEMTAVAADETTVRSHLHGLDGAVEIAALNSPRQTVLSGPATAMGHAVQLLEAAGLPTTRLKVSHAFHSRLMEPMLDEFERVCRQATFSAPRLPIVSNVYGRVVGEEIAAPEYWRQQIRRTVRFTEGMAALDEAGADVYIEIGPKPLLAAAGRQCLADRGQLWLPSLRPGRGDWSQLLESVAELYVRGFDFDWRGFDRDYPRRKVLLPNYPFQRSRYWFDESPAADDASVGAARPAAEEDKLTSVGAESYHDWLFEVQWQPKSRLAQRLPRPAADFIPSSAEIEAATQLETQRVQEQLHLPRYRELAAELGRLGIAYVWWALHRLGWRPEPGQVETTAQLADRLGAAPHRRLLLARLLEMLAEDNFLALRDGGWQPAHAAPPADPAETLVRLRECYPECGAELALLASCGGGLAGVLDGSVDALQLLFPDGSIELVERLYRDSPFARALNALLEETIATAVAELPPGRTLKILEIGAGTGAATGNLLARLPAERTEYWFTDVSQVFTHEAAKKFRRFPFVRFGVLDIESPPQSQGFAAGQFDLVIAANVLHATRNLRESLANVRTLLAPRGALVLLEGTRPQRWLDLIFGLTDGWWRFEDRDVRPEHPLISAEQWRGLLAEQGFEDAATLPPVAEFVRIPEATESHNEARKSHDFRYDDEAPPQAVIFGRASATNPPAAEHAGDDRIAATAVSVEQARWLILADRGGLGEALAESLRAAGRQGTLVYRENDSRAASVDRHAVGSVRELPRVLALLGVPHACALEGVVHLWGLDAADAGELTREKLDEARVLGCESAIGLVQELLRQTPASAARVWLVTRGAQTTAADRGAPGLAQASLWGLGRVLAEEHTPLWGGLVDLDPSSSVEAAARQLRDELLRPDGEDQVACRREQRYAARLVRRARFGGAQRSLRIRTDGSYLISGGLGDLGLRTAEWLVEQGVHHLVLLGRSPPPPRDRWDKLCRGSTRQAAQVRVLTALEARGATVFTAVVDVADEAAVSAVLRELRAAGWPPLRGVIQAVGLPDAQPLVEITPQRLAEVMHSKVDCNWGMHRALRGERLDFFVSYSSGAGLLGSPLLASYASANTFVDALAQQRRAEGLPALTIDWGFWEASENAGLTQRTIHPGVIPRGLHAVSTAAGLAALKHLLESDAVCAAVLPVDFEQLYRHQHRACEAPLLAHLRVTELAQQSAEQQVDGASTDSPGAAIRKAAPEARRGLTEAYLREQIARVLRLPAEKVEVRASLNDLGIDSLMAVELRNDLQARLGVMIPLARLLQDPTIAQLAGVVLAQLADTTGDASAPATTASATSVSTTAGNEAAGNGAAGNGAGGSPHLPDVAAAIDLAAKNVDIETLAVRSGVAASAEPVAGHPALGRLDELSDEEVDAMLRRMLADK